MRFFQFHKLKFSRRQDLRTAIRSSTKVSNEHLTPEIKLHLITPDCTLWNSNGSNCLFPDPYWGFFWAGGQALTRFVLDHKNVFVNQTVIDLGSGCGACSIAAAYSGSKLVISNDTDPVACEAISMNCSLNNVRIHIANNNLICCQPFFKPDILLVGDMFYDSQFGDMLFNWLNNYRALGTRILIGDPGRHALDHRKIKKMTLLKEYILNPNTVLENNGFKNSYVWEIK